MSRTAVRGLLAVVAIWVIVAGVFIGLQAEKGLTTLNLLGVLVIAIGGAGLVALARSGGIRW